MECGRCRRREEKYRNPVSWKIESEAFVRLPSAARRRDLPTKCRSPSTPSSRRIEAKVKECIPSVVRTLKKSGVEGEWRASLSSVPLSGLATAEDGVPRKVR
jgi:hypothetical protein